MCAPPSVMARRPEDELIDGLARKDPCALAEVDRRHRSRLVAHAGRLLAGTVLDPEDVVQDAMIRAWTSPPSGAIALGAWLHVVLRNRSLDLLRSPANGRRLDAAALSESAGARDTHAEAMQRVQIRELVEALRALPKRQAQALIAHAVEGRSHADIASELSTTTASAKALVHRARVELRDGFGHTA